MEDTKKDNTATPAAPKNSKKAQTPLAMPPIQKDKETPPAKAPVTASNAVPPKTEKTPVAVPAKPKATPVKTVVAKPKAVPVKTKTIVTKPTALPVKAKKTIPKPTTATVEFSGKIPVAKVVLGKRWNRDKATNMKELVMSMQKTKDLVSAISVRPNKDGTYLLADGHRRLMAAKDIGWKEISATLLSPSLSDKDVYLLSLVANVQREGHNPMELARTYSDFLADGLKQKEIAKACGVTEGSISQYLKFKELPENAQRSLQAGKLNTGQARQLCRMLTDNIPWTFFDKVYAKQLEGMTTSESEDVISQYLHRTAEKVKTKTQTKTGESVVESTPSESKKTGRPIKEMDYTDSGLKKKARVMSKDQLFEALGYYATKRNKAKSDVRRKYYEGYLAGLEIAAGLKDVDF